MPWDLLKRNMGRLMTSVLHLFKLNPKKLKKKN